MNWCVLHFALRMFHALIVPMHVLTARIQVERNTFYGSIFVLRNVHCKNRIDS